MIASAMGGALARRFERAERVGEAVNSSFWAANRAEKKNREGDGASDFDGSCWMGGTPSSLFGHHRGGGILSLRGTRRHIVLFYGGDAVAVQGELGDPSRRIEAVHLKQLSSRHQVKLLHVKKYLCVHMRTRILADGPTPKKTHKK